MMGVPDMGNTDCQVVSVINFKGGVGKSTVTLNLGSELASKGFNVLLIDFDSQGNLTRFSGIPKAEKTIADALTAMTRREEIEHPIYKIKDGLDIIGCNVGKELWVNEIRNSPIPGKERMLSKYINRIKEDCDYDIILIDNAPSIGFDLQSSILASSKYLIVSEADMASVDGINNVLSVVDLMVTYGDHDIGSSGIIINKYEANTNLHQAMREAIQEMFGTDHHIYENIIPKSIDAGTSVSSGVSIADYKSGSKIAEAYRKFTDEFIEEDELSF